jgi:sugar phosphate permease
LVFAGEVIFFLPFVLARVFRPTLLELFGLSNFELGVAFSVYGVVAMLAYFPGGPLADRFAPPAMMFLALVSTAIGGLVMASIPSLASLKVLYGYWGLTTILLFWAPLIRATRHWAGGQSPGRAFGLLDGGRGLVAAAVGTVAVVVYASLLPEDVPNASMELRLEALRRVILVFTGVTFVTGLLVWFVLPVDQGDRGKAEERFRLAQVGHVIFMPTVWLQAIIVVCAYVGYKGLDDVSLYANQVLQFDEVRSAQVSAVTLWMRPFAAIVAGLFADRWGVTRMTLISFALLGISSAVLATDLLQPGMVTPFFVSLLTTSAALFALRGLYFAIMEEGGVPFAMTGTAVGLVSVIGYTPDVFMGPLMGFLLDRSPGPPGHRHVFAVITGFACLGLFATWGFWRITHRKPRVVSAKDSSSA